MAALVRSAALGNYPEVAKRFGLDPARMIREAGLDPELIANPDLRIPTAAVLSLLEESARRSGCPTFGLQMAETWRLSDFGAVSLLLTHERTLRDALAATVRYRHMLNDSVSLWIEDAGPLVIVREELVSEGGLSSRQGIELAMGVVFRMFRALLGPQWRPRAVRFAHPAPPGLTVHHRIFGPAVEFDAQFNGIVCAAADVDRPNPSADPALAGHARRYLDSLRAPRSTPAAHEVRRSIHELLPSGRVSIEAIARNLGVSPRKLQRQLEEEGDSFSGLLNAARRDLVPRYLENPAYSLTQVSELLGFNFPSSFTRWFVAQFGSSPSRWRAQHAAGKAR